MLVLYVSHSGVRTTTKQAEKNGSYSAQHLLGTDILFQQVRKNRLA